MTSVACFVMFRAFLYILLIVTFVGIHTLILDVCVSKRCCWLNFSVHIFITISTILLHINHMIIALELCVIIVVSVGLILLIVFSAHVI